jgi:hypothetical protein
VALEKLTVIELLDSVQQRSRRGLIAAGVVSGSAHVALLLACQRAVHGKKPARNLS